MRARRLELEAPALVPAMGGWVSPTLVALVALVALAVLAVLTVLAVLAVLTV